MAVMNCTKAEYEEFLTQHPNLEKRPFIGHNIAAITYADDSGMPRAIRVDKNPNAPENVEVIPTWAIDKTYKPNA